MDDKTILNREKINKIKYYSAKLCYLLKVKEDELLTFMLEQGLISKSDYEKINSTL